MRRSYRLFPTLLASALLWAADDPEALVMTSQKMYAGSNASATVRAFTGTPATPREADYELRFLAEGLDRVVAQGRTDASGWATATFEVPGDLTAGTYQLRAAVAGLDTPLQVPVTILERTVLLIETDKPIYKPGQTLRGRVLCLNNALVPRELAVVVEISDAKLNKIARQPLQANAFGVAPFELGLADELNAGEWTVRALSGPAQTQIKVKVQPYVLPRFKIDTSSDKGWYLLDQPLTGTISASYFFGKPVDGTVTVRGNRPNGGQWLTYATWTGTMTDGSARFELPPIETIGSPYGEPQATGAASLDVEVTDAAGHLEKTTQLVQIASKPFFVRIDPVSPAAKPGLPYEVNVSTFDPAGAPLSRTVKITVEAVDNDSGSITRQESSVVAQGGRARATASIPSGVEYLVVTADTSEPPYTSTARIYGPIAYSPSQSYIHIACPRQGPAQVGDLMDFHLLSNRAGVTRYEVVAGGRTVLSGSADEHVVFTATLAMAPEAKLVVHRIFAGGELGTDTYRFKINPSAGVNLTAAFDATQRAPGDPVKVEISAGAEAMIGLAVVDESVLALSQGRLDVAKVYAEVFGNFGGMTEAERQDIFIARPHTLGAKDVLGETGMVIAASCGADALTVPEGYVFFAGGYIQRGSYTLDGLGAGEAFATVGRVRQFFPETWVWEPTLMTDTAGRATIELTAPDSITNWKLRAVSTSSQGLGFAAGDLTVFQDFFVEPDLPYAVTRGEEIRLPIAVHNYLSTPQTVLLELAPNAGFEIIGDASATVVVGPNSVTSAAFPIRAAAIGDFPFALTARGQTKADAIIRTLKVEPEGARQEVVQNEMVASGQQMTFATAFPAATVSGSEKLFVTLSGSPIAQTMSNIEGLIGRPGG